MKSIHPLKLGAFELNKWASNCSELLEIDNRDHMPVIIRDNATDSCILSMQWNQDTFQFLCKLDTGTHVVSKRVILSEVAKFDPLGLLGPVIVIAKILQDLWQLAIQWDESVPQDIHTRWIAFRTQMNDLNQLRIPRCVKLNAQSWKCGFCDASQRAFGTYIYIRAKLDINNHYSKLLCSKSRTAQDHRYRD